MTLTTRPPAASFRSLITMMEPEDDFDAYDSPQRPSKSAQKRESEAMQTLGEELIALPQERLIGLDLPNELLEAIILAKSIEAHHGAYKRQRKFIGKLLRELDVSAIQEQLAGFKRQSAAAIHALHVIERWRDRLLAGDDEDLNALMAEHPQADRQKLRQLTRDSRKEREKGAPPRAARLLFKYLRELMAIPTTDSPPPAGDDREEF